MAGLCGGKRFIYLFICLSPVETERDIVKVTCQRNVVATLTERYDWLNIWGCAGGRKRRASGVLRSLRMQPPLIACESSMQQAAGAIRGGWRTLQVTKPRR